MKKINLIAPLITIAATVPMVTMVACNNNKELDLTGTTGQAPQLTGRFVQGTIYDAKASFSSWTALPDTVDLTKLWFSVQDTTKTAKDYADISKVKISVDGNDVQLDIKWYEQGAITGQPEGYYAKITSGTVKKSSTVIVKNIKMLKELQDGKFIWIYLA